jgi:hypothetical protein
MPAAEKEAVTLEPWMAWIGLSTLLVVVSVAVFSAWDRAHLSDIEIAATPTAVGDIHYIHIPAGAAGPIGLKFQGRQLDMLSETKFLDAKLIHAAEDDSGVYSLYQPEDQTQGFPKDRYFMKVKPNDYIEVTQE